MKDDDRGKIMNRQFSLQVKDYSGLRFDKITATDIDGFMDFQDKVFVFLEYKHGDGMPPYGQKLALERLCDACEKAGKFCILILARHETNGDIDCANAIVTSYRTKGAWHEPRNPTTVREAVEKFHDYIAPFF